ncbi:hypothetical protein JTE90_015180 [Oedothorax gibbosus]|uniref:Uncharacterized protein n=1 Tax=Oedothorax gibbosus TaxID=931172 RepID=A0AAV6V9C8_9ARAC|nr:hypothetical protein JTE90_015180 [Oedothorax gibbosus]
MDNQSMVAAWYRDLGRFSGAGVTPITRLLFPLRLRELVVRSLLLLFSDFYQQKIVSKFEILHVANYFLFNSWKKKLNSPRERAFPKTAADHFSPPHRADDHNSAAAFEAPLRPPPTWKHDTPLTYTQTIFLFRPVDPHLTDVTKCLRS